LLQIISKKSKIYRFNLYYYFNRIVPTWSNLNRYGKSKILRTSYIWLIFIPLFAKIIYQIDKHIPINLFGAQLTFNLELPFSWKLFFASSVFFSIAGFLYELFCPEIVRDYEKYSDLIDSGKGTNYLIQSFEKIISYFPLVFFDDLRERAKWCKKVINFKNISGLSYNENGLLSDSYIDEILLKEHKKQGPGLLSSVSIHDLFEGQIISEGKLNETFWFVRNCADFEGKKSRILCGLFYLFGFVCILVLFIQNICFVVKY